MMRCVFLLSAACCLTISLATPAGGQSLFASASFVDDGTQRKFVRIDATTGIINSISPLSPTSYAGLAGAPDGRFFGLTAATSGATSQLYSLNVATNTPTLIGSMAGAPDVRFASLDILSDGRAYAVSVATVLLFPQLFSVNLQTAEITAVNEQQTISDAIIAAGDPNGYFANVLALGSVGNVLYGVDARTSTLVALDPGTGAATVVGGSPGSLLSGQLSSGVARNRYSAFAGLTGVDSNFDGEFDALYMVVNRFDDDNNPATLGQALGGVAKVDLTTGQWELVGSNPGYLFGSFGSVPAPEPSSFAVVVAGMGAIALPGVRRRS